jgi:hypothetical protein
MSRKRKPKATRGILYIHTLPMADCTYGVRAERIAELCGVDIATARRWKAGTSRIPYAAAALILGDLGAFSKFWQGWRIVDEELVSPDSWKVSRNDALAVPLLHGQIAALRQRIKELEALTDEQPYPGAYPDSIKA